VPVKQINHVFSGFKSRSGSICEDSGSGTKLVCKFAFGHADRGLNEELSPAKMRRLDVVSRGGGGRRISLLRADGLLGAAG